MAKSKLVKAHEKIAEGVVGGYKKIEEGVVGGFDKIVDRFVDNYLTKEGESAADARERLAAEQREREEASAAEKEQRLARQKEIIAKNRKNAQDAEAEARRKAGLE